MPKLGVLCIHGMGNQAPGYAQGMIDELKDRLKSAGIPADDVAFKAVYWADLLDDRQEDLMRRLSRGGKLNWKRLRREIVISGLGDPAAYFGPGVAESRYYGATHARVESALNELQEMLGGNGDAPLVVVAHSLGCAIMNDYIWDAHKQNEWARGSTPFTRGETLSAVFTFGCNLAVTTMTLRPEEIQAIPFPGPAAAKAFRSQRGFRENAVWFNFYDPDDLLGYPLRPMSESYAATVTKDVVVNTGPVWRAHTSYWMDNEVTAPIAKCLAGLARAV